MGFFNELWNLIKSGLTLISKILKTVYNGVNFIVECSRWIYTEIKNSWVGKIADALPYIYDLLDFLENKGANIDANDYKSKLKDMNLDSYGDHHFDLKIMEN